MNKNLRDAATEFEGILRDDTLIISGNLNSRSMSEPFFGAIRRDRLNQKAPS